MTISKDIYGIITNRKIINRVVCGYLCIYYPYIGYGYKLIQYINSK